jgi:site-specific DNA recombinase
MSLQAAIYLRVSTDEQAEKFGLDVQNEKCRAMATVKGWPVAAAFVDEGISGTVDEKERPGLAALIAAAEAGQIKALIVAALDRLGRKTRLVLDLVDKLVAYGVEIVSCKENLDTSTPAGQFVLTIFAGLAQLERDTIVERTTAGRNARGRKDGEKGGRLPLGYYRSEHGVQVDDAAAAIVQRIFALRWQGQTLTQIADELNRDGVKTGRGRGWHASSVREVLLNEAAYRGSQRGNSLMFWPIVLHKES